MELLASQAAHQLKLDEKGLPQRGLGTALLINRSGGFGVRVPHLYWLLLEQL